VFKGSLPTLLLGATLFVASCSSAQRRDEIAAVPPPPPTSVVTTAPVSIDVPPQLEGWETATVTIGEATMLVAVADEPTERRRGLMFVEDLEDLDGMLFSFGEETSRGFWMKNTLLPLDIAFFDADGALVDVLTMDPCEEVSCPSYVPSGAYWTAVEAPAGAFGDLAGDELLSVG